MGGIGVILVNKMKNHFCRILCTPIKIFDSAAILEHIVLFYTAKSFLFCSTLI